MSVLPIKWLTISGGGHSPPSPYSYVSIRVQNILTKINRVVWISNYFRRISGIKCVYSGFVLLLLFRLQIFVLKVSSWWNMQMAQLHVKTVKVALQDKDSLTSVEHVYCQTQW